MLLYNFRLTDEENSNLTLLHSRVRLTLPTISQLLNMNRFKEGRISIDLKFQIFLELT